MIWLGATDTDHEGQWTDTAGNALTYFNWWTDGHVKQPVYSNNRNCLSIILDSGYWANINCAFGLPCLACQYS